MRRGRGGSPSRPGFSAGAGGNDFLAGQQAVLIASQPGAGLPRRRALGGGLVGVDGVHAAGRSTSVESISPARRRGRRTKAVPRTSVICATGSRRARRWAISTSARSALPYSSRSHLAVDHDGAAHLVAPVVVVRDAAQAASMPPRTMGASGRPGSAGVDDGGAVGPLAAPPRPPGVWRRRCGSLRSAV